MRWQDLALFVLVLGVIAVAGLAPGDRPSPNHAQWDAAGRFHLEPPGQLLSDGVVALGPGDVVLSTTLASSAPRASGTNQEILSLVDGPGEPYLLLGEFPDGYILRVRADNPQGDPKRDRYFEHPIDGRPVRIEVALGAEGFRFSVDGVARSYAWRAEAARVHPAFRGRVLIGSRATGWPAWQGRIERVDLRSAAASQESGAPPLAARWLLDGHPGGPVPCALAGCPPLGLPVRVVDPSPGLFSLRIHPERPGRWLPADLLLNVLGFVPFGFLFVRLRGSAPVGGGSAWLGVAVALGLGVSAAIELAQWWIPGRNSSAIDLVCNGCGSGLGAWFAGWLAARRGADEPGAAE